METMNQVAGGDARIVELEAALAVKPLDVDGIFGRAMAIQHAVDSALKGFPALIGMLEASLRAREARIAELEAESDGRRRTLLQLSDERGVLWQQKENLETAVASLRAQLEAAQKDTERLNWLAEQSECFQKVYLEEIGWIYLTREAIDAARLPDSDAHAPSPVSASTAKSIGRAEIMDALDFRVRPLAANLSQHAQRPLE